MDVSKESQCDFKLMRYYAGAYHPHEWVESQLITVASNLTNEQ